MTVPVLRHYQERCVKEIRDALRRCRRVLLASPTGSGKTVMFCWLAMAVAAHGARIWILGHRQEIVDQISAALTAFGVEHGCIAAGRPETAAPVQVASVMTLARRLDRHKRDIDLLVVDEAHHSTAASWRRIGEAVPEKTLILGVSATPERLDGKPLADIYRELVLGPTVAELVADRYLSPAVTYARAISPDLKGLRTSLGDFEQTALAERMMTGGLIGDAVEHYQRLNPQLPGLVYCVSIAHSLATAEAFSAAGYSAVHVDGETPANERRAAIAALDAGELDLVCNCGLFAEGLDVGLLGLVIMLRPTKSLGLYLQMVGRALRIGRGKRRALLVDHAGNWERHGLYDFPHQWSLEGRPKAGAEKLARQCPHCGVVIPARAEECPECGHVFVHRLAAPHIPEVAKGELEPVDDDRWLRVRSRGGSLPWGRLLQWMAADPDPAERARRVERARRQNHYRHGWARRVLEEMPR